MIPQAVAVMLASGKFSILMNQNLNLTLARIGAIHSLVFGGFASKELSVRINHAKVNIKIKKNFLLKLIFSLAKNNSLC